MLTAPPTAWETRAGQIGMYRMMADLVETSDPEMADLVETADLVEMAEMADLVETSDPEILATMLSQAPVPTIFSNITWGDRAAAFLRNDLSSRQGPRVSRFSSGDSGSCASVQPAASSTTP